MERKHRSSLMIFKEILEAIDNHGETSISRISILANVPYSRLKIQLERMVKAELIVEINSGGSRVYRLTEKGKKTLRMLKEVYSFLESLGLI